MGAKRPGTRAPLARALGGAGRAAAPDRRHSRGAALLDSMVGWRAASADPRAELGEPGPRGFAVRHGSDHRLDRLRERRAGGSAAPLDVVGRLVRPARARHRRRASSSTGRPRPTSRYIAAHAGHDDADGDPPGRPALGRGSPVTVAGPPRRQHGLRRGTNTDKTFDDDDGTTTSGDGTLERDVPVTAARRAQHRHRQPERRDRARPRTIVFDFVPGTFLSTSPIRTATTRARATTPTRPPATSSRRVRPAAISR